MMTGFELQRTYTKYGLPETRDINKKNGCPSCDFLNRLARLKAFMARVGTTG